MLQKAGRQYRPCPSKEHLLISFQDSLLFGMVDYRVSPDLTLLSLMSIFHLHCSATVHVFNVTLI